MDRDPAGTPRSILRSERGLTLTEMVIVGVLATLVMLAFSGFYFNSQRTWLEGSSQAMTQREATLIVEHLARRVRESDRLSVSGSGDELTLFAPGSDEQSYQFRISTDDSLLHEYQGTAGTDRGPLARSTVRRFHLVEVEEDALVELTVLELVPDTGDPVRIGSRFKLYNH